jgi:hypothetical protein
VLLLKWCQLIYGLISALYGCSRTRYLAPARGGDGWLREVRGAEWHAESKLESSLKGAEYGPKERNGDKYFSLI